MKSTEPTPATKGSLKTMNRAVVRMLLIRTQRLDGFEVHDEHEIPAAGVVQLVATDREIPNFGDRAGQGEHALTENLDVPGARARAKLEEDVMLHHSFHSRPSENPGSRRRDALQHEARHAYLMQGQRDAQAADPAAGYDDGKGLHGKACLVSGWSRDASALVLQVEGSSR